MNNSAKWLINNPSVPFGPRSYINGKKVTKRLHVQEILSVIK